MADDGKEESKEERIFIPRREAPDSVPGGQIITINIGGAGVALGQSLTEQYCVERGISADGTKTSASSADGTLSVQFSETSKGRYLARALTIDLDPFTINNLRTTYRYKSVFADQCVIAGINCASNNFSIAYHTDGKTLLEEKIMDRVRKTMEGCDKLQGVMINHSLTGGTGAGLTARLLEKLNGLCAKKCVSSFSVMHNDDFMSHPAQVYNGVLLTQYLREHCEFATITDNAALYDIIRNRLKIKTPRFAHHNAIINKFYSAVTASVRYAVNGYSLAQLYQEMVPFPGLPFLSGTITPLVPAQPPNKAAVIFKHDLQTLATQCFEPDNFLLKMADFDVQEDRYMAAQFVYGGKVDKSTAELAMKFIKSHKKCAFAPKSATKSALLQIHESAPAALPDDPMVQPPAQCALLGNNLAICRFFGERLAKKHDLLFSQRTYVHHFVGHGMEEGEFQEGREKLRELDSDYMKVAAM